MTEITLRSASWETDEASLRAIRTQVFVVEQNVAPELEWEGDDHLFEHIIAYDNGHAVGTGRVDASGRIGRMAVLREARGRGIGEALLQALLERARERGLSSAHLHAQCHAQAFYARSGFVPYGEIFDEAGIDHIAMRCTL